jgi:hypothetical protein
MTQGNELQNQSIPAGSVGKPMLAGAGIGLILITIFLAGVGAPEPGWPKLWMIKPLMLVPFAGALGGVFYFNMDHLRCQGGWRKALANILSLLVYLVVLWLGVVLGLNGTMWD